MGADMLVACAVIRVGAEPKWDQAKEWVIALPKDKFEEIGEEIGFEEEDTRLEGYLLRLVDNLKELIESEPRDLGWIQVGGYIIYVSGGLSSGDSPTDAAELLWECERAGILWAAGFNRDHAATLEVARQLLGYAYPDKDFDELTAGEVQHVADNLKYAEETLARVMPEVVS